MHIQDSIIQAYLHDNPIEDCVDFPKLKGFQKPVSTRKEVVEELNKQLHQIVLQFPVFNAPLWKQMFSLQELENIIIFPVVGSYPRENRVFLYENHIIIQIDLLLIADYTPIVSQMCYILKNYLTLEITKLLLKKKEPVPQSFLETLDHIVFVNGLSNFLAWNEDCNHYVFQKDTYDKKKEEVFGLLYQVQELKDPQAQKQILSFLDTCSFWENFPVAAGMFFFDDIYHEKGINGISECVQKGSRNFIRHIFEE